MVGYGVPFFLAHIHATPHTRKPFHTTHTTLNACRFLADILQNPFSNTSEGTFPLLIRQEVTPSNCGILWCTVVFARSTYPYWSIIPYLIINTLRLVGFEIFQIVCIGLSLFLSLALSFYCLCLKKKVVAPYNLSL